MRALQMVQTIVSSVYSEVTEEYFFVDHPGLSCNGNVGVNFNHNKYNVFGVFIDLLVSEILDISN